MSHFKYIYIVIILVCFAGCKSVIQKKDLVTRYESDVKKKTLKGPVKEYRSFTTFNEENLTKKQISFYKANFIISEQFTSRGRFEFDRNGRIIKYYSLDSINQVYPKNRKGITHIYDEDDFLIKKVYTQSAYSRYVFNPYRLKLNKNEYAESERENREYLKLQTVYEYEFDEDNKVLKEIEYDLWDNDLDGITYKKIKSFEVKYIYNEKNQLTEKQYEFISKYAETFKIDHGYDARRRFKTTEKYTYTENNFLASVKLYYNTTVFFSEEYTYNNENKLISLRRLRGGDFVVVNKNTKIFSELFFNTKGDVSKIITYDDDFKKEFATYHYVYHNYDAYGNWTQCDIHLDGEIKETPTMVCNRLIEYHNE